MKRQEAALALIEWQGSLVHLQAALKQFPWGCDEPLVTLQPVHVARAIEKYLRSEVSESDLEAWAESVEGREDIGYSEPWEEQISEILFRLSTPDINGPINEAVGKELLRELSAL